MPSGKREAAGFHYLAALAAAQPAEIRERREAAEATLAAVRSRLGAPGTYGAPAALPGIPGVSTTPPTPAPGTPGAQAAAPSIFKVEKVKEAAARAIDPRYSRTSQLQDVRKLDPEAYMQQLEGSTEFRIMSRLMAESEQMLKREGPLWDEMVKNTQLPIIEGAGAMARQNAENIRRAMARGGAARRNAFEAIQKIRAQERINSQKMMALADSRLKLDIWARENARTNVEFAQNWSKNLAGIREEYNSAMDRAAELMVSGALPIMFEAKQRAAEYRAQAHAKNRAKVGRWITGALGVASLALGGIGALGLGGAGAAASGIGAGIKAGATAAGPGILGRVSGAVQPYAGTLTSRGVELLGSALVR